MTSQRVAYLTMQTPGDFVTDFHLSFAPMQALGWQVETIPWRSQQDWRAFDAVYICTPWDYAHHTQEFMAVLESIDASSAVLFNDLAIVKWNLEKTYMRDVAMRGDDIVPSTWYLDIASIDINELFDKYDSEKLVIKPTIGGNALDTIVLCNPIDEALLRRLKTTFAGRRFFVQPFVENIRTEGEYSLFFFDGQYSHAILKMPAAGDFRVQEEHGAEIVATEPPQELLRTASKVFAHIEPLPVYGRGDWVRGVDGRFLLMELELIEPSLYLRTDSLAAERFALAFDKRFQEIACK